VSVSWTSSVKLSDAFQPMNSKMTPATSSPIPTMRLRCMTTFSSTSVTATCFHQVVAQFGRFQVHPHQVGVRDATERAHDLVDDARMTVDQRFEMLRFERQHRPVGVGAQIDHPL